MTGTLTRTWPCADFAALGILIGRYVSVDAAGPVAAGTVTLLGILNGTWYPAGNKVAGLGAASEQLRWPVGVFLLE